MVNLLNRQYIEISLVPDSVPLSNLQREPPTVEDDQTTYAGGENGGPGIPRWPTQPRPLKEGSWDSLIDASGDMFSILVSLFWLWYAFTILHYDGRPLDQIRLPLQDIAKVGPTVYPMLFVAAVGGALRLIALWRLERGERIGLLDQLVGSTSVVGTIATQFKLRAVGFFGIGLILLWALSPIGGQATLRVLRFHVSAHFNQSAIKYLGMNHSWSDYETADAADLLYTPQALFIASLLNPHKNASMDTWGNIKIPMVEHLTDQTPDPEGWLSVSDGSNSSSPIYSSLIGLPVSGLLSEWNSSFSLETSYWNLDCPVLTRLDELSLPSSAADSGVFMANSSGFGWEGSYGTSFFLASNTSYNTTDRLNRTVDTDPNMPPRYLFYESWNMNTSGVSHAECYMRSSYVELNVTCKGSSCSVARMRNSTKLHPSPSWTQLDQNQAVFRFFATYFVNLITGHAAAPTSIEYYFINPGQPFPLNSTDFSLHPLFDLSKESFAISLAQLMNTYWIASIGQFAFAGYTMSTGDTADLGTSDPTTVRVPTFLNTTASLSQNSVVLVCQRGWLAALIIASSVTLGAGIVGVALCFVCRAPMLEMNISTMVRDSVYAGLPQNGTTLTDSERSRLLRNIKVGLGDVDSDKDVGRISLSVLDKPDLRMTGLKRGRLYI